MPPRVCLVVAIFFLYQIPFLAQDKSFVFCPVTAMPTIVSQEEQLPVVQSVSTARHLGEFLTWYFF